MPEVVLVAGRGPMAARAIRSCQETGSKVVAVYSDVDVDAMHVRCADDSVLLGAAAPEASYLDTAALIEAAQVSGAQAVLPVHAALAGSPELARATSDAGLLWIGADPEALSAAHHAGRGTGPADSHDSPGWVVGLSDGFRIDGLVVRRTRAVGSFLCWTSAEEPPGLAVTGLPPAPTVLAAMSDLVGGLGWQGLVSVAFDADGTPRAIRGGVPAELALVELRAGRDLVQAAISLAEGGPPSSGSPGLPAAVGGAIRATAVPGEGQRVPITEFNGPRGQDLRWEAGYAAGDNLWPWYDPVLAVIGVPGGDLAAAMAGFLRTTAEVRIAGIPSDLDRLRHLAQELAALLGVVSP